MPAASPATAITSATLGLVNSILNWGAPKEIVEEGKKSASAYYEAASQIPTYNYFDLEDIVRKDKGFYLFALGGFIITFAIIKLLRR